MDQNEPVLRPLSELLQPQPVIEADTAACCIHPHALEMPWRTEDESTASGALVLTCWSDPESPMALHHDLQEAIERTLLHELSRPPADLRESGQVQHEALWLISFATRPLPAEALRAFALKPQDFLSDSAGSRFRQTIAKIRGEAQRTKQQDLEEPTEVFSVPIVRSERAQSSEAILSSQGGEQSWGNPPGWAGESLCRTLKQGPPFDLRTLESLERTLVPDESECIRWIPSLCFQALCDLVGILSTTSTRSVDWASAAAPAEGSKAEIAETIPPLLRMREGSEEMHVPIGLELLRWCVMPKQPGEVIPPFSKWLESAFP